MQLEKLEVYYVILSSLDWQEGSILRIFQTNGVWQGAVITSRVGWNIPSLAEDNEGELYILRYGEGANVYALPLDTTDQTMSDEGNN